LADHRKHGTKLTTPLSDLGIHQINWDRDYLPEFLWLAALADKFGLDTFHDPYNVFLDAFDEFWKNDKSVALGLISDFALIMGKNRQEFLSQNSDLVSDLFHEPIGRVLAFYPQCPASWLVQQHLIERGGHLDPETEMGKLRSLVVKLFPGKDKFVARVRAVPLNRLFKHNKIFFTKDLEVVDAIAKYPHECSEEQKFMMESTARQVINMSIQEREDLKDFAWSKYFWRHNFELVVCRQMELGVTGASAVSPEEGKRIQKVLVHNAKSAREYLIDLQRTLKPDLYDPTKDEVLFGLFARMTRLYCLMLEDPFLWARDIGGIILRCLADTAITFVYLALKGGLEDFKRFIEYGEGQQKLLMLHLQDNYPEESSLEGLRADDLSDRLGDFFPELLDIELGHWAKKDTRRLAQDVGMERLYRLVYSPTSSDLHGSWLSLKHSNLVHCVEPLHRFHRLPVFVEPPFFVNTAEAARALYEHCVTVATGNLSYPNPQSQLHSLEKGDADIQGKGVSP